MGLTASERKEYSLIEPIDYEQNWLELFTPKIIEKLTKVIRSDDNYSDKADRIEEILNPKGFYCPKTIGSNIIVMMNNVYPGVVYKIAVDGGGINDNINDERLSNDIPEYARFLARDVTGVVSVQERYVVMTKTRIEAFRGKVIKLLTRLSSDYLLADVSPETFLNYGVTRDGKLVMIDGSDMIPLSEVSDSTGCSKPIYKKKGKKSKPCGGELEYVEDFKFLRCRECGNTTNPLLHRPEKKGMKSVMLLDGLTPDQREAMYNEERRRVHGVAYTSPADEDDDSEETEEENVNETQGANDNGVGAPKVNSCLVELNTDDSYDEGQNQQPVNSVVVSDDEDDSELTVDDKEALGVEVTRPITLPMDEDSSADEILREKYRVKVTVDDDETDSLIIDIDEDGDEFFEEDFPVIIVTYRGTSYNVLSARDILNVANDAIQDYH